VATAITNIWFQDAEYVAKWHDTLARAFPQRFLLGLGVSHAAVVDAAQPGRYGRVLPAMTAYLDTLDSLDSPVPPHERILAALGPKMTGLAGSRSAGAHPYCVPVDHTRRARALLGPGPLLAPAQFVVLEADPDTARGIAREHLAVYAGLPNYTRNWERDGLTEADWAGGILSDRLVDALVAWGPLERVVERVDAHHDAGADHVAIQLLPWGDEPPVDRWQVLARGLMR
jgi:probable F420-dependent oxidoreductase